MLLGEANRILERIQRFLHSHDWEGVGEIIRLHKPTWSIYYAERTQWRRCRGCGLVERFNPVTLSYMSKNEWRTYCLMRNFDNWLEQIDEDFLILDSAKIHESYDGKTRLESREVREMYGVAQMSKDDFESEEMTDEEMYEFERELYGDEEDWQLEEDC